MEERSQTLTKSRRNFGTTNRSNSRRHAKGEERNGGKNGDVGEEECNSEAWETLNKSFHDVQSVLDQNRALIQQVNENHQSKIPDNLAKNVSLIREINGNISKVRDLYSDLSVNFSTMVHQSRADSKNGDVHLVDTDS